MSLERSVADRLRAHGLGDDDLSAWEQTGLSEAAFDDWLTNRVARRPAGRRARATYGAEDVHEFARRPVLAALDLRPGDRLLELGCGGGLLLRDALASGASATGVDHSEEMVALARERAPGADVRLADAGRLPFADGSFTAIAMVQVFFFLPDPAAVLAECRRVSTAGARLAVYTVSARLRGTPASPEPMAGRSRFYTDDELIALSREAGFGTVAVADHQGAQLLTATASARPPAAELMAAFWAAMQSNDWERAASCLAADCVIDWPCSGERIVGRADFAALQARYPTSTGRWTFDVHRLVADGQTVVSEVTVTDGEQSARVIAFSELAGGRVVRQVEYWPTAYDPMPGRGDLTRPIERVP